MRPYAPTVLSTPLVHQRLQLLVWPVVTVLAVFLIGTLDEATGEDYGFFVLYFVPVALAAWRVGLGWAVGIGVLSAVVWFASDALGGSAPVDLGVSLWNSLIRLVAFLAIGWTTARIRLLLDRERRVSAELARALDEVRVLQGLLPVCAWCNRIRDEERGWQSLDTYIASHTDATVTHGMCESCAEKMVADEMGSGA